MADQILTPQKLINADEDLQTIEDFIKKPEDETVTTRFGDQIMTLKGLEKEVKKSGGYFKRYATLAAANADIANIPVNSVVKVTDAVDGGDYEKKEEESIVLTKSPYDPVSQSSEYTDLVFNNLAYVYTKNKYNPLKAQSGFRLSSTGLLVAVSGSKNTGYIPVEAGKTYTASWVGSVLENFAYAFFESTSTSQGTGYKSDPSTSPRSFTAPPGAKFVVINLKAGDESNERANFQLEEGATATTYEPYSPSSVLRDEPVESLLNNPKFIEALDPLLVKDYEIRDISRNLFDTSTVRMNRYITSAGAVSGSTGWAMSDFIPVEAGKTYTLSGNRSRVGLAFYENNIELPAASLSYNSSTNLPLTITAPAGAKYVAFNLQSATVTGWSQIQFEEGSVATPYKPFGELKVLVNPSKVDGLEEELSQINDRLNSISAGGGASIELNDGAGVLTAGLFELGVKVFNPVSYAGSAVFNFNNDFYNGVQIRLNGDDTAPVRMMGATVGANHGYVRSNLTLASHGKTSADVGSVWTDGANQWVIIQINSTSILGVTCRTENIGFSGSLPTLTHVSGAANTASFKPTAAADTQWYPMLKNHSVGLYVDGVKQEGATMKKSYFDHLKIIESYDLMEKPDIAEWLILNGGKDVKSYSAASALNVNNVHSFDTEGGDSIHANFFTYKALSAAQDLMFTQAGRLKPGVDGSVKYYVPRSIPFTHNSQAFDFSRPFIIDSLNISSRIEFPVARTEPGKAVPDRLIMLNNTIGYAIGYLPVLDAAPEVRNSLTSKGIQISNTEAKVYPYLVDGLTTLGAGANYSCVAYRKYFKRPAETRRIAEYDIKSDYGDFLFVDWGEGNFTDTIVLPTHLQCRKFEIAEKTDNISLLTKVATGQISVRIDTVTSNARLILKFL